jgi:hypothetical protein
MAQPQQDPPYHSVYGNVYHIFNRCTEGNNIERDNRQAGKGDRRLCAKCETMLENGKMPSEPEPPLESEPPYHSIHSNVYHDFNYCTLGNNIERHNRRAGAGDKRPCRRCQRIQAGEIER